jgi:hypothetical protein
MAMPPTRVPGPSKGMHFRTTIEGFKPRLGAYRVYLLTGFEKLDGVNILGEKLNIFVSERIRLNKPFIQPTHLGMRLYQNRTVIGKLANFLDHLRKASLLPKSGTITQLVNHDNMFAHSIQRQGFH